MGRSAAGTQAGAVGAVVAAVVHLFVAAAPLDAGSSADETDGTGEAVAAAAGFAGNGGREGAVPLASYWCPRQPPKENRKVIKII